MGLGKQAKAPSRGEVEAVLGVLGQDPSARKEPLYFPVVGQGRPASEGDSPAHLVDDQRRPGRDRSSHLSPRLSEQGKIGQGDPDSEKLTTALMEYRKTVPHAGPRTHRPRGWNCSHPPNHRGIPETASSAGDPPLERNPASLPPPIQQEDHSIDQVFTQPGPIAEANLSRGLIPSLPAHRLAQLPASRIAV